MSEHQDQPASEILYPSTNFFKKKPRNLVKLSIGKTIKCESCEKIYKSLPGYWKHMKKHKLIEINKKSDFVDELLNVSKKCKQFSEEILLFASSLDQISKELKEKN
jgi:hypothetical protein